MSHPESAIADLYDHEQDPVPGRRRRTAEDWGGDDLFTTTPRRRRFERPGRGEHSSLLILDTAEHPIQRRAAAQVRPAAPARPAEPPAASAPARPAGRRTVTVTGRPDGLAPRRRPAPTIDERLIGSAPERIAAYAVGMGLLLILIAILTANA